MTTELTDLQTQGAGTAVTKKPPADPVVAALMKAQNAMKAVLPKHLTPDRVSRMALGVLRTNKKLAEVARANPHSFVSAVVQSSQLGLEVGAFGEMHLVPFGNEIVPIPGYQGLVKLAKNSGLVVDIYAHEVRANDKFKLTYGLERTLEHEPLNSGGFPASDKERGEIVGFYAVAIYRDGTRTFIAHGMPAILKTRDESRGYQAAKKFKKDHPWDTHFEAMGRKTVVRALCNWLPKSAELQAALALDAAGDRGKRAALEADFVVVEDDDDNEGGNDETGQRQLTGPGEQGEAGGNDRNPSVGTGGRAGDRGAADESTAPAFGRKGGGAAQSVQEGGQAPRLGSILKALRIAATREEADEALADSVGNPNLTGTDVQLVQEEHAERVKEIENPKPPAKRVGRGGVE